VGLTTLAEVEASFAGIRSVALGGMLLENRPSALVRALLRAGTAQLFLCSAPAASWDADVLIGAGRVHTVRIPHISLAAVGLAPASRQAFSAGTTTFEECDEALLLGGYLAANHRIAVQPLHNLGTNDVVDGNPLLVGSGEHRGVAPLTVDLALLHAPMGDEHGNLVHFGSRWADLLIARAARRVVAQVDQVVSTAEVARHPVAIPAYLVDEVVEVPFGAHPLGSVGGYVADLEHLAGYSAQVTAGGFDDYLAQYCAVDHEAYLATIGATRLHELERAAV
jgi:glutaconate CoA-transferase subunit A